MNPLEKFGEFLEEIEIADRPLGNGYKAYRMDGGRQKPDMRAEIGLGTCHCCDYFKMRKNIVILIEDTRLMKTIRDSKEEFNAMLEAEKKEKFLNRRICNENILKVYGSLVVLCYWMRKHADISIFMDKKKHDFWLIVSDVNNDDDHIAFDNLQDQLLSDLRTALKKDIIQDVQILTPRELKYKLVNEYNSTP